MSKRERVYRTEGIVLRRQNLGEADRLTTIYTLHYGKLRLVAKGVRKIRSRKAGHLEPFTRVALLIARGRELDIISQAETIEDFPVLQGDLERLGYASYLMELLDRFTLEEGEENPPQYRLLLDSFKRLSNLDANPSAVILYFELRLFDIVGYRPELFQCVGCGAEIRPESQFFTFLHGGAICPKCAKGQSQLNSLSLPALKVLRHFQRSNFETATSPQIPFELFAEVDQLMEGYINYLLERQLNVPVFLRRLRHLDQKGGEKEFQKNEP
jgi:DNA repair protein RecO (recombination protein O)